MGTKLYLVCTCLVLFIEMQVCQAYLKEQVLVLDYIFTGTVSEYINFDNSEAKVYRVNDTHNRLYVHYDIIKDIPPNAEFGYSIHRSKSKDLTDIKQVFPDLVVKICDRKERRRFMIPDFWLNISEPGNRKTCIKKGNYTSEDAGLFKYWEVLLTKDLEGYYFLVQTALVVNDTIAEYVLLSPIEVSYYNPFK